MDEIEYHTTTIRMLSRVLENRNAESDYLKWITKNNLEFPNETINAVLDAINQIDYWTNEYGKIYKQSEVYLDSIGVEEIPYVFTPPATIPITPHSFIKKFLRL